MKYIHFDERWGSYVLNKKIFGKSYNFGSYDSLDDARMARDYFEEHGWSNNLRNRHRFTKTKNIEEHDGKYVIIKQINGCKYYFGRFDSYDDAEREVRLLRECNWDFDGLCESFDERLGDKVIFNNKVM